MGKPKKRSHALTVTKMKNIANHIFFSRSNVEVIPTVVSKGLDCSGRTTLKIKELKARVQFMILIPFEVCK